MQNYIQSLDNKFNFNYYFIQNRKQPIILFLHGFMGRIDEFNQVIKLLGDDFSYLTLDLPGHGQTEVLGDDDEYYKIENTARSIIKLLHTLNIQRCFLIGYSMGGRLGLYLTLHFPEKFIKVVLESASPGLPTETERLNRIKTDYQIAKKLIRMVDKSEFENFLNYWYSQPIFGNLKNHPEYSKMLKSRLENNPLILAKSLQFMGTGYQPSLWENIKENQIPLLLLVGKYDEKFININTAMSYRNSLARLQIIDQSAHNVHLENTVDFVENVKQFLM